MVVKLEEMSFVSIGLNGSRGQLYGKRVLVGELLRQTPDGLWSWLSRAIGAAVGHYYRDAVLHTVGVVVTGIPPMLGKALLAWLPKDPALAAKLCSRWQWTTLPRPVSVQGGHSNGQN